MATLYRCRTPTDWLCRCGTVAKRLRKRGIDFDEVRVPYPKNERPEVEELTGQRLVPVLVHGEEVVHDSHRILEYIEWVEQVRAREAADEPPQGEGRDDAAATGPVMGASR